MRIKTSTALLSCAAILSTTCFAAAAQENFRVNRPSVKSQPDSRPSRQAPADTENNDNASSHVYSGSAQVNDELSHPMSPIERGVMIQQQSIGSVQNWERGKIQEAMMAAQQGTNGQAPNAVHHGFLHHMASAAGDVGKTAGLLAVAGTGARRTYMGVVSPPTITIEPGHCPAATDPAFQVPYSWWQDLSSEENANPIYRDPWAAWLGAVKEVFQAHTNELRAHGIASIHVIINPDGSIYNVSPFYGEGRSNATSLLTQDNMRQIIAEVGNFPPFPIGTHVRCYHLIFDARYQ